MYLKPIWCLDVDNIQLRLDFDTFVISNPSTSTEVVTNRRPNGGNIDANANADDNDGDGNPDPIVQLTAFGQCLTDTFSVSNPDGPSPPTICGTNSGEHSESKVA